MCVQQSSTQPTCVPQYHSIAVPQYRICQHNQSSWVGSSSRAAAGSSSDSRRAARRPPHGWPWRQAVAGSSRCAPTITAGRGGRSTSKYCDVHTMIDGATCSSLLLNTRLSGRLTGGASIGGGAGAGVYDRKGGEGGEVRVCGGGIGRGGVWGALQPAGRVRGALQPAGRVRGALQPACKVRGALQPACRVGGALQPAGKAIKGGSMLLSDSRVRATGLHRGRGRRQKVFSEQGGQGWGAGGGGGIMGGEV